MDCELQVVGSEKKSILFYFSGLFYLLCVHLFIYSFFFFLSVVDIASCGL